jgi:hypothetical protein
MINVQAPPLPITPFPIAEWVRSLSIDVLLGVAVSSLTTSFVYIAGCVVALVFCWFFWDLVLMIFFPQHAVTIMAIRAVRDSFRDRKGD